MSIQMIGSIDKKLNDFISRLFKKEDEYQENLLIYSTPPNTPLKRLFNDDENIPKDIIVNYNKNEYENDSIEEQFLTVSILEELNMF